MLWSILWVIVLGYFFNILFEALLFSTVVSILKKYSGGAHASSPRRCIIVGTSISIIIGLIIDHYGYKLDSSIISLIVIMSSLVSLIIMANNAPADSIKKPITSTSVRRRLRKSSILVSIAYLLIMLILIPFSLTRSGMNYTKAIECICVGMLWQSFTITRPGIRFLNKVDFVLGYIF